MINALHDMFASPIFFLTLTMLSYAGFEKLFTKANFNPLLNPVMLTIAFVVGFLMVFEIDFQSYFKNVEFLNFLLGPATVALAIPLYRSYEEIKKSSFAIVITLILGSVFAILSAILIAYLLGGSKEVILSFAPRSATSPIAIGISQEIGGIPSLTAALVILTGIICAMSSTIIFNLLGIKDKRARGFATGLVGHGIGTAHKMRQNEQSGAFAGLAMALNGVATAILVPTIVPLVMKIIS
jgi:predicted murein hydrolase (TIGR00659 family)